MATVAWKRPVGEFIAIFAGVTLSLIADDWRESQNDIEDERAALQLILADLVSDTAEIRIPFTPVHRYEQSALWLLDRWDDVQQPDSLGYRLRELVVFRNVQLNSAGYQSLKSSNRLGLIRSDELRRQIVKYFEEDLFSFETRVQIAFEGHRALWEALEGHTRWPPPRDADSAWPLAQAGVTLGSSWEDFRKDSRVVMRVAWLGAQGAIVQEIGLRTLGWNEALRTAIHAELVR